MPEKFIVPQFIDNEDKILGPITVRQFLILLAAALVLFAEFSILALPYFILTGLLTVGIAGVFAFVKINGQPFHLFFLNAVQTKLRPKLRVWNKTLNDGELRALINTKVVEVVAPVVRKQRPASSRLRDLTLIVNTGGVYKPDDDDQF